MYWRSWGTEVQVCVMHARSTNTPFCAQVDTFIKHKYADDVPVKLRLEMGGTEDQRLLVAVMRRLGPAEGMAIFDRKVRGQGWSKQSDACSACARVHACWWRSCGACGPAEGMAISAVNYLYRKVIKDGSKSLLSSFI